MPETAEIDMSNIYYLHLCCSREDKNISIEETARTTPLKQNRPHI